MKIKNILAIGAVVIALTSCSNNDKGFKLKGNLLNSSGETLLLEQVSETGPVVIDSTKLDEKGNFNFEHCKIKEMGPYLLKTSKQNFAVLIIDSTQQITLSGNAKELGKNYSVEGSPDTKQLIELQALILKMKPTIDVLQNDFQVAMQKIGTDTIKMDSLNKASEAVYLSICDRFAPELIKKVESFPGTISNFSAFDYVNFQKNIGMYEKVAKALNEKHPTSRYTKKILSDIEAFKKMSASNPEPSVSLTVGSPMPDIKLSNPDGKTVALSSFKGKVILVDFWASWCGPCRKENPNVILLYNRFHTKGLEIYGVSLDEDKDKWVNAIKTDGLPWTHVSDLGGWQSSVCKAFKIESIPFTILVDKKGNVSAIGLRGDALEKKIEQLIKS